MLITIYVNHGLMMFKGATSEKIKEMKHLKIFFTQSYILNYLLIE